MSKFDIENVEWPHHVGEGLKHKHFKQPGSLDSYQVEVVPAQAYAELLAVATELAKHLDNAVAWVEPETVAGCEAALWKFNGGIPGFPLDDYHAMLESGQTVIDNRKDRG